MSVIKYCKEYILNYFEMSALVLPRVRLHLSIGCICKPTSMLQVCVSYGKYVISKLHVVLKSDLWILNGNAISLKNQCIFLVCIYGSCLYQLT